MRPPWWKSGTTSSVTGPAPHSSSIASRRAQRGHVAGATSCTEMQTEARSAQRIRLAHAVRARDEQPLAVDPEERLHHAIPAVAALDGLARASAEDGDVGGVRRFDAFGERRGASRPHQHAVALADQLGDAARGDAD